MHSVVVGVVVGLVTVVSPSQGSASVPDGNGFCTAIETFFTTAQPPVEGDEAEVLGAEQQAALTAWVEEFEPVLDDLVSSAPDEIAADTQVVADAYGQMLDFIRATDFGNAASVDSFNEAAAAWEEDDAMTIAFLAVLAYADTACGDILDVLGGMGGPECILTAGEVAAITGAEVVEDTATFGVNTIGVINLLEAQPTSSDENAAPRGVVQWRGCTYETSDGDELKIAELVNAAGDPDRSQFDRLAAIAIAPPALADDAFVTSDGEVVVLAGDETLVVDIDADLDVDGVALLVDVATGILDADDQSDAGRCAALRGVVPGAWGEPAEDPRRGGGSSGDISYSSCSYTLPELDGARLGLRWAEGRAWFDERIADVVPVAVDGLGDAAYRFKGTLFVLAGDQVLVIEAPDTLDAELAEAAIEALDEATS